MFKSIIFILTLCFGSEIIEHDNIVNYRYTTSNEFAPLDFSFDIVDSLKINAEYDGTGFLLNCTSNKGSSLDTIFKLKYLDKNLEGTLNHLGLQQKSVGIYIAKYEGQIKIVVPLLIEKENYSLAKFTLQKENKKNKSSHIRQHICFSNDKETICFITNDYELPHEFEHIIVQSFIFHQ